jgi:hypothetical protein
MTFMKLSFPHLLVLAALCAGGAYAIDVDVDVNLEAGHSRPRVVTVPGATVIERVWVPQTIVSKTERILVSPPRVERRSEQVCIAPARVESREEKVLVRPGRVEHITEKVLIAPARIERQWVPAEVTGEAKIGPVRISGVVEEGHWRDVAIPAEYRLVEREVQIPAKYDVVRHDVQINARFETVVKEVAIPARYEDVTRNVVIPGHYEERTVVTAPTTVIEQPRHSFIGVDLDLFRKKRDHDDRDRDHDRHDRD